MNRIEIPEKGIDETYPSCWEEMSRKEALAVSEIMLLILSGELDTYNGRKMVVDYFLNRKNSPNKPQAGLDAWNYWGNEFRLLSSVNFLFDIKEVKDPKNKKSKPVERFEINPKFFTQLVKKVRIGWRSYYGPQDLMSDISFAEFKNCMVALQEFSEDKEFEHLERLAAILYCRKRWWVKALKVFPWYDGNERMAYSENRVEKTRKALERSAIGLKMWAFLFFTGCLNTIKEEKTRLDGANYPLGVLFMGSGKKSKDDIGLTGVLFTMAESGVFGTLEETSRASLFDVLLRLYQVHRQAERVKGK